MSEYAQAFRGGASAENIYSRVTSETKHGPDDRRELKWDRLFARLDTACYSGERHGWISEWPWPDLPFPGVTAVKLYTGIMNIEALTYPRYWLISLADGQWKYWRGLAPRRWHVLRATQMRGWVAMSFQKGGEPRSYKPKGFAWTLPGFSAGPMGYESHQAATKAVNAAARNGWNAK